MSNKIRKKIHAFIIENCESEISSLSDNILSRLPQYNYL